MMTLSNTAVLFIDTTFIDNKYTLDDNDSSYTRDYNKMKKLLDNDLLQIKEDNVIFLVGETCGTNALIIDYAREYGYPLVIFPTYWDKYKEAENIRNNIMKEFMQKYKHRYILYYKDKKSDDYKFGNVVTMSRESKTPLIWKEIHI